MGLRLVITFASIQSNNQGKDCLYNNYVFAIVVVDKRFHK